MGLTMADGTSTATVEFGKCPACRNGIAARITYSMTLGDKSASNEVVTATLKPTGVLIQHECRDGHVVPDTGHAKRAAGGGPS